MGSAAERSENRAAECNEPLGGTWVQVRMNPARIRPRVAANGRVSVRLSPSQRDLFTRAATVPRDLAFALRNAPVREGKLSVRVRRAELEAMTAAAVAASAADRRQERELASLVRYLEGLEDSFAEPREAADGAEDVAVHAREHEEHRRAGMSED